MPFIFDRYNKSLIEVLSFHVFYFTLFFACLFVLGLFEIEAFTQELKYRYTFM